MTIASPGRTFPFFQLEGSPREVGRQHGRHLGDRISVSLGLYRSRFESEAHLDWSAALALAGRVGEQIRRFAPDLMDEMEGIAEGSEHPTEAIVALNARTQLLRTPPTVSGGSPDDRAPDAECTTAACLPGATADGTTILCGNWDQNRSCLDNTAVLEIHTPDRPAVLLFTEAGILMRTGINSAGLGITGNSLVSNLDEQASGGIPWPVVRRGVLQHTRLAPAIQVVYAAPRPHSGNHLMASAEGFAVDLESTPGDVYAIVPDDDVVVHSNHFVSPGALANISDRLVGRATSSLYRRHRVDAAIRAHHGGVTTEHIKAALRDHLGHPSSVCAHPDPESGKAPGCTVASHISDLDARTMLISAGPPCENPYQEYRLN